jgi:hypothetical protein
VNTVADKKFWDKEKLISTIDTGLLKLYRVQFNERNGDQYISLKEWWTRDREKWFPSQKQGINIHTDHAISIAQGYIQALKEYHAQFGEEWDEYKNW